MTTTILNRRASTARSSAIRDLLERSRMPGMISFAGGIPDPDRFPLALLSDLATGAIRVDGRASLQYGTTGGETNTRQTLAHRLFGPFPGGSPGAAASDPEVTGVDPDDLVVTAGAQQALDLVARVMLEPDDRVVCGDPDYVGFLGVLHDHGAVPHPVTIDAEGLDTERLERDLRAGLRPRACYLVPHHHNPTGATITSERRAHLHQLSSRYGFAVIEDDPYRDLHFDGIPPTEAEADPALTIRIRSTSKILSPGLRIGALVGPPELIRAVVLQKQSADLHTSTLSQALVTAAIGPDGSSFFDDHLAQLRRTYWDKADALIAAIEHRLGDRVRVDRPSGGMFVWLTAPGVDTEAWLERAIGRGACFVPGSAFTIAAASTDQARLSFATASLTEIGEGVDRLAAALDTVSPETYRVSM